MACLPQARPYTTRLWCVNNRPRLPHTAVRCRFSIMTQEPIPFSSHEDFRLPLLCGPVRRHQSDSLVVIHRACRIQFLQCLISHTAWPTRSPSCPLRIIEAPASKLPSLTLTASGYCHTTMRAAARCARLVHSSKNAR